MSDIKLTRDEIESMRDWFERRALLDRQVNALCDMALSALKGEQKPDTEALRIARETDERAKKYGGIDSTDAVILARALLAAPQPPEWVAVSERLPENGQFVLAFVRRDNETTRRIRAFYSRRWETEAGEESFDCSEYSEARDEYYLLEGWYEANEYEETHWRVSDPVTHWMPLPSAPGAQEGEK